MVLTRFLPMTLYNTRAQCSTLISPTITCRASNRQTIILHRQPRVTMQPITPSKRQRKRPLRQPPLPNPLPLTRKSNVTHTTNITRPITQSNARLHQLRLPLEPRHPLDPLIIALTHNSQRRPQSPQPQPQLRLIHHPRLIATTTRSIMAKKQRLPLRQPQPQLHQQRRLQPTLIITKSTMPR